MTELSNLGTNIPRVHLLALIETQLSIISGIQRRADALPPLDRLVEGAATKKEREALHALDGVTVEMWLARQCLTTSAARLGALCVEMTLGCQPAQLSMLQFLDYVRMNGGIQFLTEVEAGAQQWWVGNGGAGRVASLLLDKIKETHPTNFTAKLGCAAAAIRCTGAAAGAACPTTTLRVEAAGGAAFVARQVILAVPPTAALEHLTFDPPPPVAWAHAAQRSFMGCYTKCVAVYDAPFWREKGLSGTVMRIAWDDTIPVQVTRCRHGHHHTATLPPSPPHLLHHPSCRTSTTTPKSTTTTAAATTAAARRPPSSASSPATPPCCTPIVPTTS